MGGHASIAKSSAPQYSTSDTIKVLSPVDLSTVTCEHILQNSPSQEETPQQRNKKTTGKRSFLFITGSLVFKFMKLLPNRAHII